MTAASPAGPTGSRCWVPKRSWTSSGSKNPWYSSSEVRMNRRFFGALGVVAVFTFTVGSCKSDPFADVHGTPAAVVTDFSYLQLPTGSTAAVTASIVDATATPLAVPITLTPCPSDITLGTDPHSHPIPLP